MTHDVVVLGLIAMLAAQMPERSGYVVFVWVTCMLLAIVELIRR